MDIKEIYEKLESTLSNEQRNFIVQIKKNKTKILNMYKDDDLKNYNFDTYKEDQIKKNNLFIKQVKTIIDTDIDMKSEKIGSELFILFKHDIFDVRITIESIVSSNVGFCLKSNIDKIMYTSAFSQIELNTGIRAEHMLIEQKKSNFITRHTYNSRKQMDSNNKIFPLLPIIELINSDIYDKNNIEDLCELYLDKKINLKQESPESIHISHFMKIKEFIENNELTLRKIMRNKQ